MKKKLILFAPLILLGSALFVALGGEIVRLLWNWLLPSLFGWPRITFWQALGLLALCRILFGGLGGAPPQSRSSQGWPLESPVSRGARTMPAAHSRTLGLRPVPEREQGAVKLPASRSRMPARPSGLPPGGQ